MSLSYSPIGSNPYGMHRVLIVTTDNANRAMWRVLDEYHPNLLKVVSGFDIDKNELTGIDGAKWLLTASGFVVDYSDHHLFNNQKRGFYFKKKPENILDIAGDSQYKAINLLQHFLVVFRPEVPSFIAITDDKIMVSSKEVDAIALTAEVVDQETTNGKGYTFSYVLPDGFVLADYVASTLIPINNNYEAVSSYAAEIVRKMGNSKIWELLGWEMRRWMANEVTTSGQLWQAYALRHPEPVTWTAGVVTNPYAG